MKSTQKVIIFLIVIVILIILITILGIYILQRVEEEESETYVYIEEIQEGSELVLETNKNRFYTVKDCINKYYTYSAILFNIEEYYGEVDDSVAQQAKGDNAQIIYNMLDEEYINYKNITTSNIETKIEEVENSVIDITKMYSSEQTDNISIYIVEGTLRDKKTNEISSFKMMVKLDYSNETYTITPQDYLDEKYPNIDVGTDISIDVPDNIEKNDNNKYVFKSVSEDTYAIDLFEQIKEQLLYNKEESYSRLDTDYKNTKFDSLTDYTTYVQNKYGNIQIDSYKKTSTDEYTQYVLLDTDGNYYICRETAVMNYTLILDTYTIDIPEFTDRYDESTDQEKVILNLNKVMLAMNDGDYKYVYRVLADSFKTNYFQNYETFETYMKNNFFTDNEFDYMEFGDEAGTYYTYKVKITDATGNSSESITKTFIILLGDGTDFDLSFNVN